MAILGILKEEPKLLYYFEYIKRDDERVKKNNCTNFKEEIVDRWEIGTLLCTENPQEFENKEFYKPVFTFRKAFVGDMQKKFDKAYQRDNMLAFCESKQNLNTRTQYVDRIIYIYVEKPSLFERVWAFLRGKEVKSDLYLERELFEKNNTFIVGDTSRLEDYLNNSKEL